MYIYIYVVVCCQAAVGELTGSSRRAGSCTGDELKQTLSEHEGEEEEEEANSKPNGIPSNAKWATPSQRAFPSFYRTRKGMRYNVGQIPTYMGLSVPT